MYLSKTLHTRFEFYVSKLLQTNKRGGAAGERRLKKKYPTVLIDRPRELSHMAASTHGY